MDLENSPAGDFRDSSDIRDRGGSSLMGRGNRN